MMNTGDHAPVKIGIIAGEESGQLLAADLIKALQSKLGKPVNLIGVGGASLAQFGLASVFDPQDIALTGIADVIKSLPRLIGHVRKTADFIARESPDCLLLVDSPDFSLRVAKRVRALNKDIPIVKYVAPTVWAWRPDRAAAMLDHVDHVMALFPFEPMIMQRLGGPKTTYVGHRLMDDEALLSVYDEKCAKDWSTRRQLKLCFLPGSRNSEIKRLIGDFAATLNILIERGHDISITIPTLPRHVDSLTALTADWQIEPTIVAGRAQQVEAYKSCDVALAASGTVLLEAALAGLPVISIYRLDVLARMGKFLLTTWSAALPNIIGDRVIVPEYYDSVIAPGSIARVIEELVLPKSLRRALMMEGYGIIRDKMALNHQPADIASDIVLGLIANKKTATT